MERASDFEKLLFFYKTWGQGKGISQQPFVSTMALTIVFFDKLHRNHHEGVVSVQVVVHQKMRTRAHHRVRIMEDMIHPDLPDDGCESVEVSSELLQEVL